MTPAFTRIREFLRAPWTFAKVTLRRVVAQLRSNWRLVLGSLAGLLLFLAWHSYLHPHLWLLLSRVTDAFLALALYGVGGLFVLLGCLVSVSPPKTNLWKTAGVIAFLLLFYAGFVITKEQATRTLLAAQAAKLASDMDAQNKKDYDTDVNSLRGEIKGTKDAIESVAKGSQNPKWNELLARLDTKEPPRFELEQISIQTLGNDPTKASQVRMVIKNAGGTAAEDIQYQIAVWDWRGNREPSLIRDSVDTIVEPGNGIDMQPFPIMIPQYTSDQLVRIWLRYKDVGHPERKPIVQTIFRDWNGTRGGVSSSVFNLLSGDPKKAEDFFNKQVPIPQ